MPENGQLRVHGQGDVEVELVVAYLNDFRFAYNGVLVFEESIEGWQRATRHLPFPFWEIEGAFAWSSFRRSGRLIRESVTAPEDLGLLIPKSEQLVLSGVTLQSPGFWDFLGRLNPLGVLCQYLNDRHERRKDRQYRESAEERRLRLENLQRENEVIAGRIKIAKDIGATERDLALLLNQLVYRPLAGLDRHQDLGTINVAEIQRQLDRPSKHGRIVP